MGTKYYKKRNRRGIWEVRWSEKAGDRYVTRSATTGTSDEHAAEVFLTQWIQTQAQLERLNRTPKMRDLLEHYERNALSRGVGDTQRRVLARLAVGFGDLRPGDIDDDVIEDYRASRGVADATLRRELNALIAVLNHAQRKKLLDPADVPHIDLPPEGERREVVLTPDEEEELTRRLWKDPLSRVSRFGMLALRTGARKAAIEGLTWDRVDLRGRLVDYREPGRRKTKKRRVPVPIDDALLPLLERAHAARGSDPHVIGEGSIRKSFETWRRNNPEFSHVTPHVFRHTAATRWLREGVSIWNVAGLLGDTVETTVNTYGHHASQDLLRAMNGVMRSAGT